MASPRKAPKQSTGWGGFLQQAVLSVESRLDNILADEDQASTKTSATSRAQEQEERGKRYWRMRMPSLTDRFLLQLQWKSLEVRQLLEPTTACRSDSPEHWQRSRARDATTVPRLSPTRFQERLHQLRDLQTCTRKSRPAGHRPMLLTAPTFQALQLKTLGTSALLSQTSGESTRVACQMRPACSRNSLLRWGHSLLLPLDCLWTKNLGTRSGKMW